MVLTLCILSVLYLRAFCVAQDTIVNFNPAKLRILDYNSTYKNFLIRGDYPGREDLDPESNAKYVIEYNLWKTSIETLIETEKKIKISDFFIIDISLVHHVGTDGDRLKAEIDYFKKYPDRGEVIYHEINGTEINATQLSPEEREKYLDDFDKLDKDLLVDLMTYAHDMINTKQKKHTVIYWHCVHGVDRTGEVSGSYMMKYFAWDYKKAYDYNTKVKGGKVMTGHNGLMMNWYCFWLEKKGIQKGLECKKW